jgi:hypothetical protein
MKEKALPELRFHCIPMPIQNLAQNGNKLRSLPKFCCISNNETNDILDKPKDRPLTIPPLSDEVGYCGDDPSFEQILNGTYDTTGLESNVALLRQRLKQTEEIAALATYPTIFDQEYRGN